MLRTIVVPWLEDVSEGSLSALPVTSVCSRHTGSLGRIDSRRRSSLPNVYELSCGPVQHRLRSMIHDLPAPSPQHYPSVCCSAPLADRLVNPDGLQPARADNRTHSSRGRPASGGPAPTSTPVPGAARQVRALSPTANSLQQRTRSVPNRSGPRKVHDHASETARAGPSLPPQTLIGARQSQHRNGAQATRQRSPCPRRAVAARLQCPAVSCGSLRANAAEPGADHAPVLRGSHCWNHRTMCLQLDRYSAHKGFILGTSVECV